MSRKLDIYSKGATKRHKPASSGRIVSLPLGQYSVAGKIYKSRSDAEAAAARLDSAD